MAHNAHEVLEQVKAHIADLETAAVDHKLDYSRMQYKGYGWDCVYKISAVCEELSIFDWWNEKLSKSQLKQMQKFLETAIKMGYTGYVCFKVGAAGCANGMWAHKQESTDGYSPREGGCLFRGFRSDTYNEWDARLENGTWLHEICPDEGVFTLTQVKNMLANCEQ